MASTRRRLLLIALLAALLAGGAAAAVTAAGDSGAHARSGSPAALGSKALAPHYGSCPSHDPVIFASRTYGASAMMVPAKPIAALLCRYSGGNAHPPLSLVAHRLIDDASATRRLAAALNALPPRTGVFHCPADFGTAVIAFFRYRDLSDDSVKIGLTGCQQVSNGHLTRLAGPMRSSLAGKLKALTP